MYSHRVGKITPFGMLAVTLLCLFFMLPAASAGAASGTKSIRDNSTGGDCTSIGTWNNSAKTCTLTSDYAGTIGILNDGITLDGGGHTLSGSRPNGGLVFNVSGVTVKNLTISGYGNGLLISGAGGNFIICNTIVGNDVGVNVDYSDANVIAFNTISGNGVGVSANGSSGNEVNNNRLEGNVAQAEVDPSGSNTFSQNYFDDFDTPAEGCSDLNGDDICDAPYAFTGGSDPQARTAAATCGRPDLRLYKDSTVWASYGDYLARHVSVNYSIHNLSTWTAYNVTVTGSLASNGAALLTPMSVPLGNLGGTGTVAVTLQYSVPSGIAGFITNTTGTATNACGTLYTYP